MEFFSYATFAHRSRCVSQILALRSDSLIAMSESTALPPESTELSARTTSVEPSAHVAAFETEGLSRRTAFDRIGNVIFWPIAFFLFIHRVFILAINGSVTDDFTTVYSALRRFLDGVPVYNENYEFVDPHYLYNPGATLVLSPMALLDAVSFERTGFILINALAIIAALGLLTRMFGFSLKSFVWPAAVVAAYLTEAVRNTLIFANINGVLLLALVGFLWALLKRKNILAGIIIGLAILIKPLFLPLLFLPLVRKQWATIAGGVAVPVIANLVAWPLVPGASDYLTRTAPYLGIVRDYSNSSLRGMAVYFGFTDAVTYALLGLFAVIVGVGVLALLAIHKTDPLLWVTSTTGLLLAGVFLLSSLGQMYYSMMLFPLIFTVVLRISAMHNPVAWMGIYLCLSPDSWSSERWRDYGRWFGFFQATAGWALIIISVSVAAVVWTVTQRRVNASRADSTEV